MQWSVNSSSRQNSSPLTVSETGNVNDDASKNNVAAPLLGFFLKGVAKSTEGLSWVKQAVWSGNQTAGTDNDINDEDSRTD